MAKRKVESQINSLTPDQQKSGIDLISLHAGGMPHTIGKLLTRATTLFRPHFNRRFVHKVIEPQSRGNPNFGNFGTPIWESQDKMPFGCGPCGEA
jgi:hypothetical protein